MRSQREFTRWLWLAVPVLIVLLVSAALLGDWLSDKARSEAADASGLAIERVEADGLDITLTGFTDAAERDAAVAAVDELDSTWDVTGVLAAGQRDAEDDGAEEATDAATEDEGSQDSASDQEDAAEDAAADNDTDAADADTASDDGADDGSDDAPSVGMAFDADGTLVLTGVVADDDQKQALVAAAASQFGADQVTDEIEVAAVADGAVQVVLAGEAVSEAQRETWLAAADAITDGLTTEITDDIEIVAGSVDQSLNALVDLDPIEFDERRATVRSASFATLDEAAQLINDNPDAGVFRVIGHTDSDGDAEANERLSLARAEAVVTYLVTEVGVDPQRLDAVGAGETDLLIEPELTPADKQRNRRIEWELVS